jgi:imidazoleglycerol-phosphate dehydratase
MHPAIKREHDMQRRAEVTRRTKETNISANLDLDGSGKVEVKTGVGFFDHMVHSAMVHGYFDLSIIAEGDTHVDDHHTVEDVGIVLGQAFSEALGDFGGIKRFGHAEVPMEEALARVALDLSRRPCLVYVNDLKNEKVGSFDTELVEEFLRAFSNNMGANMHVEVVRGKNGHHVIEAIFKAMGRALDAATMPESRAQGVTSTKGAL